MRLCGVILLLALWVLILKAQPNPAQIRQVHVVAMNHLDVGFDGIAPIVGYAFNVLNKYFDVYFPRAIDTSNVLRQQTNGQLHYVYTTHPYLVSLYLDCPTTNWTWPSPGMMKEVEVPPRLHCPSTSQLDAFKAAIMRGDITWHAFPFNAEAEVYDSSLFESALRIAARLDEQFNKPPTITMSQRDVPGLTRSAIPLLHRNGIKAITVGVNGASAPPAVDKLFTWRDAASGTDLYAMWNPGGYGDIDVDDCVMLPNWDQALAFAIRGDNSGPHNVPEAMAMFTQVRDEFPNAVVNGSTYDSFVRALEAHNPELLVVESEIGDTWIHGVPSDPLKLSQFREVMRSRNACIQAGACNVDDKVMQDFDRLLMKVGEHTWGLDVKTFLLDFKHWSNAEFQAANKTWPGYKLMANSWIEQRSFISNAIEVMLAAPQEKYKSFGRHLQVLLAQLTPRAPPSTQGMEQVAKADWGKTIEGLGTIFDITIDPTTGAIAGLFDRRTKRQWASRANPLAAYTAQTFDAAQYTDNFLRNYLYCDFKTDCPWADGDFGKPNVSFGNPKQKNYTTTLANMWRSPNAASGHIVLQMGLDPYAVINGGAPRSVWLAIDASVHQRISIQLYLEGKTATRLPEAHWLSFTPDRTSNPGQWLFSKLGANVDPFDVVLNGSHHLHGVDDGGVFYHSKENHNMRIITWDAGIVANDMLTPFPVPLQRSPASPTSGVHANLYNNI